LRENLAQLKKADGASKVIQTHEDRFQIFVGLALGALLLEALLPTRRRAEEAS
jgi:hypothetical protein